MSSADVANLLEAATLIIAIIAVVAGRRRLEVIHTNTNSGLKMLRAQIAALLAEKDATAATRLHEAQVAPPITSDPPPPA